MTKKLAAKSSGALKEKNILTSVCTLDCDEPRAPCGVRHQRPSVPILRINNDCTGFICRVSGCGGMAGGEVISERS